MRAQPQMEKLEHVAGKGVRKVSSGVDGIWVGYPLGATSLCPGSLWALIRLTFHFYTSTAAEERTFHRAYGRHHMAYG